MDKTQFLRNKDLMLHLLASMHRSPSSIKDVNEDMMVAMVSDITRKRMLLPVSIRSNRIFIEFITEELLFLLKTRGLPKKKVETEVSWFLYEYGLI